MIQNTEVKGDTPCGIANQTWLSRATFPRTSFRHSASAELLTLLSETHVSSEHLVPSMGVDGEKKNYLILQVTSVSSCLYGRLWSNQQYREVVYHVEYHSRHKRRIFLETVLMAMFAAYKRRIFCWLRRHRSYRLSCESICTWIFQPLWYASSCSNYSKRTAYRVHCRWFWFASHMDISSR